MFFFLKFKGHEYTALTVLGQQIRCIESSCTPQICILFPRDFIVPTGVRPQLIVVNLLLLPEYFCLFALEFANLCMGIQLINILELFTSSQPDQVLREPDIQQKYGSIPLLSKCQVHSIDPYYQYLYSTFVVTMPEEKFT